MRDYLLYLVNNKPYLVGFFFAAVTGYAAFNCFRAGMAVAAIRGDAARAASEALGG